MIVCFSAKKWFCAFRAKCVYFFDFLLWTNIFWFFVCCSCILFACLLFLLWSKIVCVVCVFCFFKSIFSLCNCFPKGLLYFGTEKLLFIKSLTIWVLRLMILGVFFFLVKVSPTKFSIFCHNSRSLQSWTVPGGRSGRHPSAFFLQ